MENKLQTEVKEYAIVFKDRTVMMINKQFHDHIWDVSGKGISQVRTADGKIISISSIDKLLDLEEYYEQYPDRRPSQKYANFTGYDWRRETNPRALELMMEGLKKYIDSPQNQGTGNPEALYAKMKERLDKR